ncbi:hypothetical protein [Paracoccus sp. ME4]|uniref:hypothetical protein n=1 Tax=Paracoccus sp. ME4 TaxID=3138066 RepID=UPI00398AC218
MREADMLWHGSNRIFRTFSLDRAGRTDNASNGALGIWCAYESTYDLAKRFAGDNGALYGIEEPSGRIFDMPVGDLARHNDKCRRHGDHDGQVGYYDRIRRDLIDAGYDRIDIIERHGGADMCVLLEPERIRILERTVTIIPHDRLERVLGLADGEIIGDEEFTKYHAENRRRLIDALRRHISNMGVEDLAANGSRNFSTRVGELNQRRLPFRDALDRLTEKHEEIWRDDWERIEAGLSDAEMAAPEPAEDLPEPAF